MYRYTIMLCGGEVKWFVWRCCSRLIKDFDREIKDAEAQNNLETNKLLNEKKQSLVSGVDNHSR